MSERRVRSSWEVTWSVWSALFIREALQRTMANRFSWFWMLAQPMAQILMFVAIREVIGRLDTIAGAPYIAWLIVGMMVYMLFSEGMVRSLGAIDANKGLLSYRQVKVIDPIIARICLEAYLKTLVLIVLVLGFSFFGFTLFPSNLSGVVFIWILAAFFGLSTGVFFAAVTQLMPGLTTIIRISTMPLYFLSGVMIPVNYLPHDIQSVLRFNPILHLVELMRAEWFNEYRAINDVTASYVLIWCMCLLCLGLMLIKKYSYRMTAL